MCSPKYVTEQGKHSEWATSFSFEVLETKDGKLWLYTLVNIVRVLYCDDLDVKSRTLAYITWKNHPGLQT